MRRLSGPAIPRWSCWRCRRRIKPTTFPYSGPTDLAQTNANPESRMGLADRSAVRRNWRSSHPYWHQTEPHHVGSMRESAAGCSTYTLRAERLVTHSSPQQSIGPRCRLRRLGARSRAKCWPVVVARDTPLLSHRLRLWHRWDFPSPKGAASLSSAGGRDTSGIQRIERSVSVRSLSASPGIVSLACFLRPPRRRTRP